MLWSEQRQHRKSYRTQRAARPSGKQTPEQPATELDPLHVSGQPYPAPRRSVVCAAVCSNPLPVGWGILYFGSLIAVLSDRVGSGWMRGDRREQLGVCCAS